MPEFKTDNISSYTENGNVFHTGIFGIISATDIFTNEEEQAVIFNPGSGSPLNYPQVNEV